MMDESALFVRDGFDTGWAEQTLDLAQTVADLLWLAILTCHQKAIQSVSVDDLEGTYPVTSLLLKAGCTLR
jgi:hypothetical protein